MNAPTIGTLALAALLLAGCETLNGQQAYANAEAQQEGCRDSVSVVTNTPEQMRLANRPDSTQTDDMKRAEGRLALAGVKKNGSPKSLAGVTTIEGSERSNRSSTA